MVASQYLNAQALVVNTKQYHPCDSVTGCQLVAYGINLHNDPYFA